jgi:signal transduction histidine kinase
MRAIAAEGRVEREIRRLGYRGSVVLRVGGTACASILGMVFGPAGNLASVAIVVAVNAWGIGYLVRLVRNDHATWPRAVDTCLVAVLCLTQRWTVRPEVLQGITNWVPVAVALTVLAYQWQGRPRHRVIATAAVIAAYLTGSVLAGVPGWIYSSIGFGLVLSAVLSWSLYRLVVAGAREADRLVAGREQARRDAEVAAARRADEREQLAALHDGAMATMLAVGMGVVAGREPWLCAQAARDLEVLAGDRAAAEGQVDLGRLLGDVARGVPVGVESRLPGAMHVPALPAVAVCQAAREALVNVSRHAGVDVASLLLERRAGMVVVEVADEGRGFHPARVSPLRHGLSLSIVERMVGVGGRATVLSHPGGGTRVRLEWPHG